MWGKLILCGAAGAILLWLNETAEEERQRWQDDHEQFKQEIKAHRDKIESIITSSSHSYDFKELIDLHYISFSTADQAKKLLDDSRVSLDAIGQALVNAREQRDKLKTVIKNKNNQEKIEIIKEIGSLNKLRKVLFKDKDDLKEQRNIFLSEVRKLNSQTRQLKHTIRDCTGARGKEWYDRLQQRINGCSVRDDNSFSINIGGFKIKF